MKIRIVKENAKKYDISWSPIKAYKESDVIGVDIDEMIIKWINLICKDGEKNLITDKYKPFSEYLKEALDGK